ncbi:uncharacterized protein [Macrobrachium rosenbergii]|uniref:uncharacterized protein n=1 Tax=Macrobrachium rosenbergii TaxID=79674 RepID=UPI0034D4FDFB
MFIYGIPGRNQRFPGAGSIATLGIESIFTNVHVDKKIDLIIECTFRDPSTPQLNIPEGSLRTILKIYPKKAPFSTHKVHMYRQKDGEAMGSSLGVLVAKFYMGTVEEQVFSRIQRRHKYAHYIGDIFVQADNEDEVEVIHHTFQQCRSLNYTVELSSSGQLPFLDILICKMEDSLGTSAYTKQTNLGLCLNGDSEWVPCKVQEHHHQGKKGLHSLFYLAGHPPRI